MDSVRPTNVLLSSPFDRDPIGASRASPRAPYQEPVVRVSVLGHPLLLPERALRAGLSDLRLATGEHVALADYASGVALVLEALATSGFVSVLVELPIHDPQSATIRVSQRNIPLAD